MMGHNISGIRFCRQVLCVVLALSSVSGLAASLASVSLPHSMNNPSFEKERPIVEMVVPGFVWVDAEDFGDYGGWTLDTQFVHLMGSAYLLATGIGLPVDDAVTEFTIPQAGRYHVWVRARNWVREHAPGTFQVLVNGEPLPEVFGDADSSEWVWEKGGELALNAGSVELALHDLTGFYGRCDAVILTADPGYVPPESIEKIAAERARLTGISLAATDMGAFDVIVVGAGSGGCPAAISAARHGARTALITDRPVLGGNSGSELGVPSVGAGSYRYFKNARESGICEEVGLIKHALGDLHNSGAYRQLAEAELNLTVSYNSRVVAAVMDGNGIEAVKVMDTLTGKMSLYRADQFIDCTGDGWLGYYAGAEYRYGRESQSEYGEDLAPEDADEVTMSGCLMAHEFNNGLLFGDNALGFISIDAGHPAPYKTPVWAAQLPPIQQLNRSMNRFHKGEWWIEHSGEVNDLWNAEQARDELLRIIFAYWGIIKNEWSRKEEASNYVLATVPYMTGRRETRRLMGDYVLTQQDVLAGRVFPDRISYGGWKLDIHHPKGIFSGQEGPFDFNVQPEEIFTIPYRSLYSKNIENLLFAGRCVSVTHVALGAVRVQRTLSTLGQAAGTAAALCIQYDTSPRGIYETHISELQQTLLRDDQYIPELCNEDPDDLAQQAALTVSSTLTIRMRNDDVQPGALHSLDRNRAVVFPVHPGQMIDTVELLLTSRLGGEISVPLYMGQGGTPQDALNNAGEVKAEAVVDAGYAGWISFDGSFRADSSWVAVWLPLTDGVGWRLADESAAGFYRAHAAPGKPWSLVKAQKYAFRLKPSPPGGVVSFSKENLLNGLTRPVGDDPNMWASNPIEGMPQWVEFSFEEPVEVASIQLTFDTNLDLKFPSTRRAVCVRDYKVEVHDGTSWNAVADVTDNLMRHQVHCFSPVHTDRIRITVEGTYGDPSARIFEIRLYGRE